MIIKAIEGLQLSEADILLVRGATSTVGMAAIQLAKAEGARVIAACRRSSSFDKLYHIGADLCVVDNGNISCQELPFKPNKVLKLIGPKTLHDSLACVSLPGYVCSTGILGNVFTVKDFDPIKHIPNGVYLTGFFSNYPVQETIDEMFGLIRKGNIVPLYANVFKMDEIAEAHLLLENGGAGGKIILKIC